MRLDLTSIAHFKDRVLAPHNGLHVTLFDHWHPALDEALASLPEMDGCPHELFRLLVQTPGPATKKSALVAQDGVPVAVIAFRLIKRHSYDLLTWIIPGAVFPAKPGYLMPALEALGVDVWVSWRRMGGPPPVSRLTRSETITPIHQIVLSDDFEAYWRKNNHFKTVQNKRNRCHAFTLAVNTPGSAEWTLRNAEAYWRDNPAVESPYLNDWIVAAQYLENRGRHYTLTLLDQDIPIGGATLTVHGKDVVGGLIYRKPEYDRYGVGVRLIDLCISFAAESGFERLDLGAERDYKKHWAPQADHHWLLNICPEPLFRAKQVANLARQLRAKATSMTNGQAGVEASAADSPNARAGVEALAGDSQGRVENAQTP